MRSNLSKQLDFIRHTIDSYIHEKPLSSCLWFVLLLFVVLSVASVFVMAIWADAFPHWVGFGAYDEIKQGARAKTLWDWMELLIIPAIFLLVGAGFTYTQRKTEQSIAKKARELDRNTARDARELDREVALERQRQQTLEKYLDKISELLLDRGLSKKNPDHEVQNLARILTLNVLREMNSKRNKQIIQLLSESGLLEMTGILSGSDLRGVDLGETYLARADLTFTDLSGANLNGANLTGANLSEANLSEADLWKANLSAATLTRTKLNDSNLSDANLFTTNLSGANLNGANLSGANLGRANLKNAKLVATNFTKANLMEVDFDQVDLTGANLTDADLSGSIGITRLQVSSIEGILMPHGLQFEDLLLDEKATEEE